MNGEKEINYRERMPDHSLEVIPSQKWVRVFFGGKAIADSRQALLLRRIVRTPVYYFPKSDVRMEYLSTGDRASESGKLGTASYWNVQAGGKTAENAAWSYSDPDPEVPDLKDHIAFKWNKMDAWFEESEEVFVHPRDPYHRIDVLHSSRHIEVILGGEKVAESRRPALLFETGLPVRYYLPKLDVRMDLLAPSETITHCPYKGDASHFSAKVHGKTYRDIAWSYTFPHPEMFKIQNLICFYDERVDAVFVDGQEQEKPHTPWAN